MSDNSSTRRIGNISVDLDSLHLYYRIHGIDVPEGVPSVYETGVSRFLDLFQELDVRATLFVVAEDALRPENRRILERAVREGHELASHSYSHPYELIRLDPEAIQEELRKAEEILRSSRWQTRGWVPGSRIQHIPELLRQLSQRGYRYDSSFSHVLYYAAASILGVSGDWKPSNHPGFTRGRLVFAASPSSSRIQ